MNSKEALEILFASYNFDGNYHDLIIAREKLEQDLDKLEQLENENQELKKDLEESFDYNALRQLKINSLEEKNTKLEKALDILKNKVVIIHNLLTTTLNVYNSLALLSGYDKLTQEEYELLKGVLGDEN